MGAMNTATSGLAGFKWITKTLNFVLESTTFCAFLHQEAMQLIIQTLRCGRPLMHPDDFAYIYQKAQHYGVNPAWEYFNDWMPLNPIFNNDWHWIFSNQTTEIEKMSPISV